ncbi:MAG: Rieske (2Fe-2S) protein [bacterium]
MPRRTFLKNLLVLYSVLFVGVLLWIIKNFFFFREMDTADNNKFLIGRFSHIKNGEFIFQGEGEFFISRDNEGLYAMSNKCTHLGCRVKQQDNVLLCPCHKSSFSLQGIPLSGPAKRPLAYYRIYEGMDNLLFVDKNLKTGINYRFKI